MELTPIMQGLKKRIDVSQDADKTKERATQLWKGFNNKSKRELLELADVSSATAHKVYQQGALTAGLAIAFAKLGGVSPSYVTAHSDARGKFTKQSLNAFLEACGYEHLIVKPSSSAADETEPVLEDTVAEAAPVVEIEPVVEEPVYASEEAACTCPFCDGDDDDDFDFGEDELIVLLRALLIRAQWNEEASEKLKKVIELLL